MADGKLLPRIAAVDFDGTLNRGEYGEVMEIDDDALDILLQFQANGGHIILWTVRCGSALDDALLALSEHGFTPDMVNANMPGAEVWLERNNALSLSPKVYADVYIDDRATVDGVVDWDAWKKRLLG